MNEDILTECGWNSSWDSKLWHLDKMILWVPNDCDYTLITSENNYKNTLFKGIIETKEELEFITKLLTKKSKNIGQLRKFT